MYTTRSIFIHNSYTYLVPASLCQARSPFEKGRPRIWGFHACSQGLSSLTLDSQCTLDTDCRPSQACLGGQCKDPCTQRGACGKNALCQIVNHQVSCSCVHCHKGDAEKECLPDPVCSTPTTPRSPFETSCNSDQDCPSNEACGDSQLCQDPCSISSSFCEPNKRCEVRQHRPICVCQYGFTLNSAGEFICAGRRIECRSQEDCLPSQMCHENKCVNPCAALEPCPPKKKCAIFNHQPVCICEEQDCQPSVSICFNDKGCPTSQACVNYQCTDPCETHVCPGGSPCYTEDHKPQCKFCPSGFTVDENYGCVPGNQDYSDPHPRLMLE